MKDIITIFTVLLFIGSCTQQKKVDIKGEGDKLIQLNKIIHPAIIKEIKSKVKKKTVIDAALLIETKTLSLIDKLIVVTISKKEATKRTLKKKKYNKEEINTIFASQLSQKEKLKYADAVIDNNKTLTDTKKQI